jgi:hypothetical protein
VAVVLFVEDKALWMMSGLCGHVVGDRAADEGCGIRDRRGLRLGWAGGGKEECRSQCADERKEQGGRRIGARAWGHRRTAVEEMAWADRKWPGSRKRGRRRGFGASGVSDPVIDEMRRGKLTFGLQKQGRIY